MIEECKEKVGGWVEGKKNMGSEQKKRWGWVERTKTKDGFCSKKNMGFERTVD